MCENPTSQRNSFAATRIRAILKALVGKTSSGTMALASSFFLTDVGTAITSANNIGISLSEEQPIK